MRPNTALRPGKRCLWGIILTLVVLNALLIGLLILRLPKPNYNALAIGAKASVDSLDIVLMRSVELDYKTKAEVLNLRKQAVARYAGFIAGNYEPADSVFGQIEDRLPWWGIKGQFFADSGQQSIDGPSEEARFVINPYLLVAADFWGPNLNPGTDLRWAKERIMAADLNRPDFPFVCEPSALRWYPREARAEATYFVGTCMAEMSRWTTQPFQVTDMDFDLIAYNARDLNLNYLYISFKDSLNIRQDSPSNTAFAISHFIHRGGSCGYPGGCNNMSPATPEISNYEITKLPARLAIKLWTNNPQSVDQSPDMLFILHFK